MPASTDQSSLLESNEDHILVGRISLVLHHLPNTIGASMLTYTMLAYWLFKHNPSPLWLTMCACMALLTLGQTVSLINYRNTATTIKNVKQRCLTITLYSGMCGLLWGSLGYLGLSETNVASTLIIMMVFTSILASFSASLTALPQAIYCLALLALAPVIIKLVLLNNSSYQLLGIMVTVYIGANIFFSTALRAAVHRCIDLGHENLKLINNLTHEKQRADTARTIAEDSNNAKSKFIAAASHDLRQPLQALRLLTATLDAHTLQPDQKHLVVSINKSVRSLEELFNSLLDISKLDSGTVQVDTEHFDLQNFISRINQDCRVLAQNKGLAFETQECDHVVATDALLLERVIRNLTNNSIRYTTSGTVSVGFKEDQNRIYITVEDTGCGIHSADVSRVFDEFVQVNNQERNRSNGLGLGLSIVKRICNLLQITINLDSVPDRGTRVTIGIPRGDRTKVAVQNITFQQPHLSLSNLFIVIVEDSEEIRSALTGLLSTWGCQVVSASSGDEVIEKLRHYEYEPDAIIADYRLRENLTGAAAIKAIEASCGVTIPAVISTGDVGIDQLKDIDSHGYPILHKPFEPYILATLLAGIANNSVDNSGESSQ